MKADSLKISKVFSGGGDIHYVLPHFQRQYSWEENNWKTLLTDAFAIYDEYQPEKEPEHFLGSLVVINDEPINGVISVFKLVDGQQRLTTISLLLCVLRDLVQETEPKTAKRIQRMLVNSDECGDVHLKVLPTTKYGDRDAYKRIILGEPLSVTESNIPNAYAYLRKELSRKISSGEILPEQFYIVLSNCFQVVFIDLNKDESPYKIFESLNAKGKSLSQADLVRNYIAMKLPTSQQEKVFTEQWEKIENLLQERRTVGKSRLGELTAFLRHYLAMCARVLCSEEHIYARFRDRCETDFSTSLVFINELKALRRFAEYYDKLLRPENEKCPEIKEALTRLNILEIQTAYPFLLAAYDAYESEQINLDDLLELFKVLENYMIRRYICGEKNNYLNTMFPTLWRDIITKVEDELSFKEAVKKALVTKNYPSNRNVQQSIYTTKLYDERNQKKLCLVLETINRYLSTGTGGFTVLDSHPTIEHILPQKPGEDWQTELGNNLERIYQDYLHTLGNLTLVTQEWNTSLSNSSFLIKKHALANHALQINNEYFSQQLTAWDENSILRRAEFLTENILKIWSEIGETTPLSSSYGSPKSVTICGNKIEIPDKTWRQLMKLTTEWVIKHRSDKFEDARQILSSYFSDKRDGKKNPKDWHQLLNSVWVFQGNSAKGHVSFCRRFLIAVSIPTSEWSIEEYKDTDLLTKSINS